MVCYLGVIGGNDLRDVTYPILLAIFAPNVAVEIKYEGHREKLGFPHLKLIKVVHKAVWQKTSTGG